MHWRRVLLSNMKYKAAQRTYREMIQLVVNDHRLYPATEVLDMRSLFTFSNLVQV